VVQPHAQIWYCFAKTAGSLGLRQSWTLAVIGLMEQAAEDGNQNKHE
jgi:hypothetical protein